MISHSSSANRSAYSDHQILVTSLPERRNGFTVGGGGNVHGGADEIPTDVTPGVPVPVDSGYQVCAMRGDICRQHGAEAVCVGPILEG
jgi:hypothetical protein